MIKPFKNLFSSRKSSSLSFPIVILRSITLTVILTFIIGTSSKQAAYAADISAKQMEQFQKLPKAQQAALAKSMGVDLNSLKKGGALNCVI